MKKYFFLLTLPFILHACSMSRKLPEYSRIDEIPYPFAVQKINLPDDITLAYVEEGQGPVTILFIHGLGSYLPAWKKNVEDLRTSYRCIAIDLPGYGHSGKGNYPGDMRFYARVIRDFVQAKQLGKVVLAGHSMGGQIALTAALAYPELVDKLILVAPAGFETFNKGEKQWFRDVLPPDAVRLTTVEQIRTNLAYNFYRLPKDAQFMIDDRIAMRSAEDFPAYCHAVSASVKGMVDEPVYEFLPQVKQPTLCLFGENDNLIPNRYLNPGPTEHVGQTGANRMPHCKLVMLPKTGHFAMFESAEKVNAEIRGFLGE